MKVSAFWKDAFAIFIGGFLGALFGASFGYSGLAMIGAFFSGGIIGYIARMLFEPKRIKDSFVAAWRKVFGWRIKSDWKDRVRYGLYAGLGTGGIFGVLCGIIFTATVWITAFKGNENLFTFLLSYIIVLFTASTFAVFIFVVIMYFVLERADIVASEVKKAKDLCREYNPIMIHYTVARYIIIGLLYIPDFLKTFMRFVHSSDFTSCAFYAAVCAALLFFIAPSPYVMGLSALGGGVIGATIRRIAIKVFGLVET